MKINNIRVKAFEDILTPEQVVAQVQITAAAEKTVFRARNDIQAIIDGEDDRKIIIVGPCSIHDKEQALDYARKLNVLREELSDKFIIVMRTYFEKPRTTVGWKGFIYDPGLDGVYGLQEGVKEAREVLVQINDMGLPTATEVLGPIVIQYYADLICWSAIGARTAESQTHRELASGLSMPVGFKNGTEGNVDIAINAILASQAEHGFLGMDDTGKVSVVQTKGNPYGHLILRGGKSGPNYDAGSIAKIEALCKDKELNSALFVDCSHANSAKDYKNQGKVWKDVWEQINAGSNSIVGLMLESNLKPGRQDLLNWDKDLEYGVSVTDACIGWEETEELLRSAYKSFR